MDVQDYSSAIYYADDSLFIEKCAVDAIVEEYGTPIFIYSTAHINDQFKKLSNALKGTDCSIHYAVKANSNLSILNLITQLGGGFDVVSGGELLRALKVGALPENIVFSGVGKTEDELTLAIKTQIGSINVESPAEAQLCAEIAKRLDKPAHLMVRVNPNVDAKTHPYISTGLTENKFGLTAADALASLRYIHDHPMLIAKGIACHIGSQLIETSPFDEALRFMLDFYHKIKGEGIELSSIDLGGGLGIKYGDNDSKVDVTSYANTIKQAREALPNVGLSIEPGRYIVGNAGIFVSKVINVKKNGDKHFIIIDGAMNDVLRPALYSAEQQIVNTKRLDPNPIYGDIVGPICESADFLAKSRTISAQQGDNLALLSSGAYCASMSSNYNSRARAAEVLVDGDQVQLITRRESFEDLIAREIL